MRSFRTVERIIVVTTVMVGAVTRAESLGTGFVYQGELVLNDELVSEACDFEFTLWDAATVGTRIGAPLSRTETPIGGRFAVELDFGPGAITGEARWLEIEVRCPAWDGLGGEPPLQHAHFPPEAGTGPAFHPRIDRRRRTNRAECGRQRQRRDRNVDPHRQIGDRRHSRRGRYQVPRRKHANNVCNGSPLDPGWQ
ncbi:MAG: hypothetical protein ACE5HE_14720 [Phycisphaerae bacterium]